MDLFQRYLCVFLLACFSALLPLNVFCPSVYFTLYLSPLSSPPFSLFLPSLCLSFSLVKPTECAVACQSVGDSPCGIMPPQRGLAEREPFWIVLLSAHTPRFTMKSFFSSTLDSLMEKKSTFFCFSSAALFPIVLSPVLRGTAIVWLLSGYLSFHPWPRFYCRLGRNVFPPRNFSVFFFLQLFLITLVVVLVWKSIQIETVWFSRANCVSGSSLLFSVCPCMWEYLHYRGILVTISMATFPCLFWFLLEELQ